MSQSANDNDPMNFVRNLWGNMGFNLPGMVVPTLDTGEIGKQIEDLKAVEGWLRMNLSMLQMTIHNLEMQRTTLDAVHAMGRMATDSIPAEQSDESAAAMSEAAMWPWAMMQEMQEKMLAQMPAATPADKKTAAPKKASGTKKTSATDSAVRGGTKKNSPK